MFGVRNVDGIDNALLVPRKLAERIEELLYARADIQCLAEFFHLKVPVGPALLQRVNQDLFFALGTDGIIVERREPAFRHELPDVPGGNQHFKQIPEPLAAQPAGSGRQAQEPGFGPCLPQQTVAFGNGMVRLVDNHKTGSQSRKQSSPLLSRLQTEPLGQRLYGRHHHGLHFPRLLPSAYNQSIVNAMALKVFPGLLNQFHAVRHDEHGARALRPIALRPERRPVLE